MEYNLALLEERIKKLSTRSQNIIGEILQECNYDPKSFYTIINSKDFNPKQRRNVGLITAQEITRWIESLDNYVVPKERNFRIDSNDKLYYCERVFESMLPLLPLRAKNELMSHYKLWGASYQEFHKKVFVNDYQFKCHKNFGPKSENILSNWLISLKESIYDSIIDNPNYKEDFENNIFNSLGLSNSYTLLTELQTNIEHFPLFRLIHEYLFDCFYSLSLLLKSKVYIFDTQENINMQLLCEELDLGEERIRQLKEEIIHRLEIFLIRVRALINVDKLDSYYLSTNINTINDNEKVHFNRNFVLWVLSIIYPTKYHLVGNSHIAFFRPRKRNEILSLVPKEYADVFDFESFLNSFKDLLSTKRKEDIKDSIQNYTQPFYKKFVSANLTQGIISTSSMLLKEHFGIITEDAYFIVKKNAEKNNTDLVEMILRENGKEMSLEEIYNIFTQKYPNKTKSLIGLKGAIWSNPKIISIGKSSKYYLEEWKE